MQGTDRLVLSVENTWIPFKPSVNEAEWERWETREEAADKRSSVKVNGTLHLFEYSFSYKDEERPPEWYFEKRRQQKKGRKS